eukprot:15451764-Alexandrium_andersonii.AAC.1
MSLRGGRPPLSTGRVIQSGEAAAPTELELRSLNRHARNKPQRIGLRGCPKAARVAGRVDRSPEARARGGCPGVRSGPR